MRIWLKPDVLARLGLTVTDVQNAVRAQNVVNPAGQVGAEPAPPGQQFTYTVRAQGRLVTPEEFGDVVVRANPDGSLVRVRDVARIELGSLNYAQVGRLQRQAGRRRRGLPAPGLERARRGRRRCARRWTSSRRASRPGMDYAGLARHHRAGEGGHRGDPASRWSRRSALVVLVVFIFLQSWRATLIPLLTVPVSLVGVFVALPVARLLDQHAVAVRAGAGHRPGRRRRHRRRRGGRAPHRGGHVAARGDLQGDVRGARRRSSASRWSWRRCSCRWRSWPASPAGSTSSSR